MLLPDLREAITMSDDSSADSAQRYEKTAAFAWTERAFELLESGRLRAEIRQPRPGVLASHVWGRCPRCGHDIDDWQPLSAVTGLTGSRQPGSTTRDTTDVEPVDINCGCGTVHSGAPADITGCGVSFRVELEPVPEGAAPERE
jgi:hypothetical protein